MFRRFLDEINSPFVGAYFDVGNIIYIGYPDQWIRILGPRIKRVHIKYYKKSVGTADGEVGGGDRHGVSLLHPNAQ